MSAERHGGPTRATTADTSSAEIQERYRTLYARGGLSLSKNFSDKFPLIEHVLQDVVRGKTVLDFGCGPGRLALMLARHAGHVHGVDYAGEGIELAGVLARASGLTNVSFAEADLPRVMAEGRRYDVVVLAGVFEHLEKPLEQLQALGTLVTPGGVLCVQNPSFGNFRGDVYNTLGNLFGWPMSLTDLWQVTPKFMDDAARTMNFRLEKVVGGLYRLAFLDRVLDDFRHRVPAAARDAGLAASCDFDRFFAWMEYRVQQNQRMLDDWLRQGLLKPVPAVRPLAATRPAGLDDAMWRGVEEYLTYDGWREPWYSDAPPVCHYGASAMYLMRKTSEA